ncbi:efflux RND transporter periplasmic adaptor subunit [Cloacibacillus sp. An23]|uniref:efflux RND transporter periplasmic adaptor subunit n=1 Tax=Cloacibacillus sp. An23 TaxID=1965591 RepID=UPI000B365CDF|nr:efflux RND transporter periplasmic adaptor subunit [Cloacibacillus sp. An23]OUO94346.1 efflux transporter periplasmic adaptor subunit [Cloacibacillus sp. An23]
MQGNGEHKNVEINGKTKSGLVKIVAAVVVIAAVFFGYKAWKDGSSAPVQQAASEPVVVVKQVEKFDASSVPSEYVGRVESIQSVSVKPQISGEIAKVCFKEGSIVKAGELLFQIDPKQYEATVQLRKAELQQAEANFVTAEKYYNRVMAASEQAVSATDRDTAEGNLLQTKAAVAQAKANLRLAQIDLNYCRITSPITGKIGKALYTKGNYVTPSVTELASIVQMDPIRVSYPLPDRDYLDQLELFKSDGSVYNTKLTLSNGTEYNLPGKRDFEDNRIDQTTGTIMMRLRFENKAGELIPGEMVRVFTKPAKSRIVNAVPQTAVMADEKGDYAYVVNADNTVRQARITLGREFGQLREVVSGLEAGENVVVAGLQRLSPGAKVRIDTGAAQAESGEAAQQGGEAAKEGN